MISTNVRANETFLVAKAAQTTIPTSGTVNNSTTGNVNLADGQLGLVSDSIWGTTAMNSFVDDSTTLAEAPVLAIYQGNSNSANMAAGIASATYPLWARPFERSNPIDGRGEVKVTKQAFRDPAHSTWVIGNTVGEADAINVADETLYELTVAFRGRRVEEMFSGEQALSIRAEVTSPDFTALGDTDKEATSWILHNLAWNINRNSTAFAINSRYPNNAPVLALLVDTTGASGTNKAIGGVTPIAAGDSVTVVTSNGQNKTITVTTALANSIKNAAIAATGDVIADVTWEIITVNLATAKDAASLADAMILIALDDKLAFVDLIPQVKNRLEVGLSSGFNSATVRNTEYVQADPGQGDSRTLELWYKATHGQRKYNLRHTEDPVTEFPSPFVSGTGYVTYAIHHGSTTKPDISNSIYTPYLEVVCIPALNVAGNDVNALIATFDSRLNTWLAAVGQSPIVTL